MSDLFDIDENNLNPGEELPTMQVGICPFCGKSQMVQIPGNPNEKEIEDAVVAICDCAKAHQEQRKNGMNSRIDMLFGDGSVAHGFDDSLSDEERKSLLQLANDVLDAKWNSVVIGLNNGDKAKIAVSGDQLKISRESRNKQETKL